MSPNIGEIERRKTSLGAPIGRNRPAQCTPGNSGRWRGDCVGPALPYPRSLSGDGPPPGARSGQTTASGGEALRLGRRPGVGQELGDSARRMGTHTIEHITQVGKGLDP